MSVSICIFARNEEQRLPSCVGALGAAGLGDADKIHILINGCTDNTAAAARSLAEADARITAHELPVGDKANAWNDYAHRIADSSVETHVFMDGDITASEGAITALAEALRRSPEAYAAAALPAAGRSRRGWATLLLLNNYLSGNLYALSGAAVAAFRQRDLRLPFGAKGEDGLITYLLLTDLQGGSDDSHRDRIVIAEDATFEFDSLQANWRDFNLYRRRLRRYSERHFQKQVLYRLLKENGAAAMPETIYDIYTQEALASLRPRLDPVNYWFDVATLKRLRARQALSAASI
ncbi:glycosyltransferase [Hyphococcus sp.]|jgi:glycosyltransferase involved in cell wall biosynthesis|uniref:glycosyltransferase n=1 Tax=Hyphococcus sp. TaxID=2038636 RepID=UPI003D0BF666